MLMFHELLPKTYSEKLNIKFISDKASLCLTNPNSLPLLTEKALDINVCEYVPEIYMNVIKILCCCCANKFSENYNGSIYHFAKLFNVFFGFSSYR